MSNYEQAESEIKRLDDIYHDTVAQSRADMEDGVINPATMREELSMAKEDFRVELENLIGPEKLEDFLAGTRSGMMGGF